MRAGQAFPSDDGAIRGIHPTRGTMRNETDGTDGLRRGRHGSVHSYEHVVPMDARLAWVAIVVRVRSDEIEACAL